MTERWYNFELRHHMRVFPTCLQNTDHKCVAWFIKCSLTGQTFMCLAYLRCLAGGCGCYGSGVGGSKCVCTQGGRVRGGRVYCVVSCVSVLITFKYCIMICDWLSNDKWLLSVMILRVFTNLCSSLLCHDIADMWCVWAHWHMLWILSRC